MTAQLQKRPPLFTGDEYVARLATTREAMAMRGLDALIICDPANMAWLTGYDGAADARQAIVLGMEGAPIWWGRESDAPLARLTTWMADSALRTYADADAFDPARHPYRLLTEVLIEEGHAGAKIGVELDSAHFSAGAIGQLLAHLSGAQYLDATGLIDQRRMIKSDAEVALMQRAAAILDQTHAMIVERAEPGLRKSALGALIAAALIEGGSDADGDFGGDMPAIAPRCPSGAEIAAPRLGWDDDPLEAGEATAFALAASHRRYHAASTRMVHLGAPSQELSDAAQLAEEALAAAIDAAQPGATAGEIAEASARVTGADPAAPIGHCVGLAYPPRLAEGGLAIRAGDATELLAGMALHIAPTATRGEHRAILSETVVIGDDGASALNRAPRGLVAKR